MGTCWVTSERGEDEVGSDSHILIQTMPVVEQKSESHTVVSMIYPENI